MGANYGPAVENGNVRYFSASSLQAGDRRTQQGCERRYYYKYVERRPEPKTIALARGSQVDDEITAYLTTGIKNLGPIAMTGLHMMPPPGPDLHVQTEIKGLLKIDHADIVGQIDLYHKRGINVGGSDFGDTKDPPNTVEILDWKTTSSFDWCKAAHELPKNVQMVIYGEAVSRKENPEFVRLSHGYMRTKGGTTPGRKITNLVPREMVAKRYEEVETLGRRLIEVAKAATAEDVEPNYDACGAYGGCPHRSYCDNSGDQIMSLLSRLDMGSNGVNQNQEAAIAAEQAKLMAQLELPPGFREACNIIDRAVFQGAPSGWPPVGGEAARLKAIVKGIEFKQGTSFAGSGKLAKIPVLVTPDQIIQLAKELTDAGHVPPPVAAVDPQPAQPGPPGQPVTPYPTQPHSPAPQLPTTPPAPAPEQTPQPSPPGQPVTPYPTQPHSPAPMLPPDAPKSQASLAAQPVDGVVTQTVVDVPFTTPQAKRGRPAKAVAAQTQAQNATQAQAQAQPEQELNLYINAIPNFSFDVLDTYIREMCAKIEQNFKVPDIRVAQNESPLAYGKWKGVVAAMVRAQPPQPGTYVLISRDEISEAVCEALKGIATSYVYGVR